MKKLFALAMLVLVVAAAGRLSAAELKPGDEAPAFSLDATDGKTYSLGDYQGKEVVVVAWFPKANTPGCTRECKSLRSGGEKLREYRVAYFTASVDKPADNLKFAESLGLDYPILSDPDKSAARAYGVLRPNGGVANRWTFYIGTDGKILFIDKMVNPDTHAADIAKKLAELGVEKK